MVKIQKYRNADLRTVARLVYYLFKKHVSTYANNKGREWWLNYLSYSKQNLKSLKERYDKCNISYVATDIGKIIGVIMGDKFEMKRLFIKGYYQNKGIGTRLLNLYEKECSTFGTKKYKIIAGLNAVGFYQKMGCKKSTGVRVINNLKVQPLYKVI